MKKLTIFALMCVLSGVFCISPAFAGPFGIDMGMSLAQVKAVCRTTPKHIQDNVYEITPPKTNDIFETYYVRIDPDYGVYWLKAIGKEIYTNGYGDRLKSTFESLVESIRRTYGEASYIKDDLKEGSIWGKPQDFMHALQRGDRTLNAFWDNTFHDLHALNESLSALRELLDDTDDTDRALNIMSDSTALKNFVNERKAQMKKLPSDISVIGIFAKALSTSKGCVYLEYSFSNNASVEEKADSVF